MKAYIKDIAYYLPEAVEVNTNAQFRRKTGIESRHIFCYSLHTSEQTRHHEKLR